MHVIPEGPWLEYAVQTLRDGPENVVYTPQFAEVFDVTDVFQPLLAAKTDNLPNQPLSYGAVAAVAVTPLQDVYNTVWVVPGELRVGSVTATTEREVEVWNAYREPRILEDIPVTSGEGINVTGPVLPYTFGPLENFTFAVQVTPEGPATINARYDFQFTLPEGSPHFTVAGQRIIQWTVPPNWGDGVEETIAYRTEIIEAFDGSEQRIATRHRPRRSFSFTPLAAGEPSRRYKRLLSTWQHRNFAMPDWSRGVLFEGLVPGALTVTLREPMPELRVGQLLSLRTPDGFTQSIEVSGISGSTVDLNSPTAERFPPGSRAYPGLIVHADPSLSARRHTSGVGQLNAAFTEMHVDQALTIPAASTVWRSREVFVRRPNWAQTVSDEHNFAFDWLDSGRGRFDYRTPHQAPKDVRKLTFLLRDRDDVRDLEGFFLRMRGRRGECYLPTLDDDISIPDDYILLTGGSALPVDVEDADRMVAEKVYRNVYMLLSDGTELFRQVLGADLSDAEEPKIGLGQGWPRTIYGYEVVKCCWLPRARLATDSLVIRWVTDRLADATLAFQVLPDVE